jgi:Ca2+-binding EF-hand superfamily protein
MLSDFQKSKLARRFELLDADGDGYVTAADYDEAAANVCRAFGFAEGSPQHEKVHVIHLRLWTALSRRMEADDTGRINRRQFAESCARSIVEAERGYDRIIGPIAQTIFDLVDGDDSGTLEVEELAAWFNAYGVCADDAERAFKRLDRNGDGVLDLAEVQQALKEFYTSDDPEARGNAIFGPLPPVAVPVAVPAKPKPKAKSALAKK